LGGGHLFSFLFFCRPLPHSLQKEERKAREEAAELRSYKSLFEGPVTEAAAVSNKGVAASVDQSAAEEFEDDFM